MNEMTDYDAALLQIPTEAVSMDFAMNPETDDLVRGDRLRNGSIVLIESTLFRDEGSYLDVPVGTEIPMNGTMSTHRRARILESSRWCMVTELELVGGPIISFFGLYADGTKRERSINISHAWFVKKDTI